METCFTKTTNSMVSGVTLTPSSFQNASYKMEACINMDLLGNCPSDSASNDYDILIYLDSANQLSPGDVVVAVDGLIPGNLLPDQELSLHQVLTGSESVAATVWQRYPRPCRLSERGAESRRILPGQLRWQTPTGRAVFGRSRRTGKLHRAGDSSERTVRSYRRCSRSSL